MNIKYTIRALLLTVLCFGVLQAQSKVYKHPQPGAATLQKWDWAFQQGKKGGDFWIATSVERLMHENRYYWSNGDIFVNGRGTIHHDREREPLQLILQNKPLPASAYSEEAQIKKEAERALQESKGLKPVYKKEMKEIALLFHYDRSARNIYDLEKVVIVNMNLPFDLKDRPVYWLGKGNSDDNLAFFSSLYKKVRSEKRKDDLISVVGLHPNTDKVVAFLTNVVKNEKDDDLREEAIEWLGEQDDPRVLDILIVTGKNDVAANVREEAVEALAYIENPAALDALIDFATHDKDSEIRETAVESLGRQGSPKAMAVLKKITFEDKDLDVQEEALSAVISEKDDDAFAFVQNVIEKHAYSELREEAVEMLKRFEKYDVADLLEKIAFHDRNEDVQETAVEMFAVLSGDYSDRLVKIVKKHPSDNVREEALEILAKVAADKAIYALEETIKNKDDLKLKLKALNTLADMDNGAGLDKLIQTGKTHPDRRVRKRAIRLLGEVDDPRALDALIEISQAQ